jgi:eukaryotic-like serine/threonine-protein kinase
MVLVFLLLVIVLALATMGAQRSARATAQRSLEQSADLVAQLLAGRGRSLGGGARVFVQGPYFRTLVAERRRDDILDQTLEAAEQLEASWVFITDDQGTLVAKSDEPSAFGESLGNVPLVSGALRGQVTSGFGGSGDSLVFQATAVPIAAPGGMPFGVLVATRVLDSLVAMDIAQATNQAVLFYVRDENGQAQVAANSLAADTALRSAMSKAIVETFADSQPTNGTAISGHHALQHADRLWLWYGAPLATAGGTPVGGYVVVRAADDAVATMGPVRRSLALAALVGVLCAVVAATLTARLIAQPVTELAAQVAALVEQGEAHGAPGTMSLDTASPLASAEIAGLANAVGDLLLTTRDQDVLRPVVAAAPSVSEVSSARAIQGSSGNSHGVRGTMSTRTLAFRTPRGQGAGFRTIGRVLANRYRLDAEIGQGGHGTVYRAHDMVVGETVAIKLLRPEALGEANDTSTLLAAELRLARRVTHRHVVRLHDIGDDDGEPFLSMEYVDGVSLAQLILHDGAMAPPVVAALARQLLRGVAAAHEQGVVHGDIKPHNVLVSRAGILKVGDFGLARLVRGERRHGVESGAVEAEVSGRVIGARVGTPEYMAPELLIGGAPSPAADCYAVGLVLHECLVGGTPFAANTPVALLDAKLRQTPASGGLSLPAHAEQTRRDHHVPRDIERLLRAMTATDAAQRPGDLRRLILDWQQVGLTLPLG